MDVVTLKNRQFLYMAAFAKILQKLKYWSSAMHIVK